ncbi:MAG TPA: AbrB/MazE/SpoVT family DNA-binding domain-containing protein [Rhizomicrobium sp.]|jgi:antitoxin VapB|nr:AbrB/MazE/SpoVT family DNA-binding domain-containing protein [Rhizomicrobium sp.]
MKAMRTRVFKSGNSQAIRIPAELAYANTDVELEIRREGDIITIAPVANTLREAIEYIRGLPKLEHRPVERLEPRRTLWDPEDDEGKK